MITSSPYYKGSISIHNAGDTAPNSNLLGNVAELKIFIEEYELDVLIKCLGYSLNKEFQSHLEVVSGASVQTVKSGSDQKWKDLFSGKEYVIDGVNVHWRGLVFKDGSLDRSLLAYYVFHHFLKNDMSPFGTIGVQIENTKKNRGSFYRRLYVDSWNKFYDLTADVSCEYGLRTLYQFIKDMNDLDSTTYPNWMPYTVPKLNIMSL